MLGGSAGVASATAAQDSSLKGTKIDHISIQVTDLPRATAFYQNVFGMSVVSEDKRNEIVRIGMGRTISPSTTKALRDWWTTTRSGWSL